MGTLEQNKEQLEEAVANKLKEAKSLEELKEIAAKEGYELSDEQLEGVAGGLGGVCPSREIKAGPEVL